MKKCLSCTRLVHYYNCKTGYCKSCVNRFRKGRKNKGGWRHTEEHKLLMSALMTGRKVKHKSKLKMSMAAIKRYENPDYREKHSLGQTKRFSDPSNHPSWKGGITPINAKLRRSNEYTKWRLSVFERDDYTCQECGDCTGGNLNAHHIKAFAYYPDLRFEISNGITLCETCHAKTFNWKRKMPKGVYV